MKKRIIIAVTVILVSIAAIAIFAYIVSFHKISVTFSPDVSGAVLYKEKGSQIKKFLASGDISLQNGSYYIIPEGEKVSKEKIPLTVKDDNINFNVDPDYSSSFLKSTLITEQSQILKAATDAFALIGKDYIVDQGSLYRHGEWFGAILTQKTTDIRDERDFYRILLHKDADTWKVVGKPVLVMTTSEFKDVPVNILKNINQLTQ